MSLVAGFVVETLPGAAERVAARLSRLPGISVEGGDGNRRLAAVWTAGRGGSMAELAEQLLASDPDLLGIYPTFVGNGADEEE